MVQFSEWILYSVFISNQYSPHTTANCVTTSKDVAICRCYLQAVLTWQFSSQNDTVHSSFSDLFSPLLHFLSNYRLVFQRLIQELQLLPSGLAGSLIRNRRISMIDVMYPEPKLCSFFRHNMQSALAQYTFRRNSQFFLKVIPGVMRYINAWFSNKWSFC